MCGKQPADFHHALNATILLPAASSDCLCLTAHPVQAAGGASDAALLRTAQALLELWDGVCAYFSAQAKPGAWTATLLKALRLVPPETRAAAAAAAQVLPASCESAH